MNGNNPDRELMREYLLGRLDYDEAAETKMSEDILFDDEFADVAESVEDEILEAYLEGTLSAADRKSVEDYFLQPPERQQKLRFIQVLEGRLATNRKTLTESRTVAANDGARGSRTRLGTTEPVMWWKAPLWVYGQLTAVMVLALVTAAYTVFTQKKQTALENDLNRERALSASLINEVSQLQPSIVKLSLVPGLTRGPERMPRLDLKTSTKRILFEVAVRHPRAVYSLRLEARRPGELLWTATLLPIISPSGDGRLVFDLPAEEVRAGGYTLAVSDATKREVEHYEFDVAIER